MVITENQQKNLTVLVALATLTFFCVSIWGLYEAHKYRKADLELKKDCKN